jgi:hypothetical protein
MAIWRLFCEFELSIGLELEPAADYNGCFARFNKFLKKYAKRPVLSAAGCNTRPDHSAE